MWHWQDVLRRTVLEIIFFGIFMFIIYKTYQGLFSLGVMFMLIQYAMNVRMPIFSMSFIVDNTQKAIAGSRDFFEVMETVPQIADESHAKALRVSAARIDFDAVSFSYKQGDQILRNITFTVQPDTKVALVGESGQGKTTLTNLLMRFYALDSGEIRIDDQPIAAVTQKSLRRAIGVVFQEPNLFSGTIHENIAYARPSASRQEVIAAAKAANAHDFIKKFPDGYQTEIGERGVRLSGGQKQRIAIARAVLKDAPILLLDEATSSLDSRSERVVQDALEQLMKGRTTIIIAHRLSTIAHVDQIVTLRNGTVDEIGSPAELAKTDGIYGQLLRLQGASAATKKRELKKFDIAPEGASDHADSTM
jgi:ATP-binding cassette subfamily B protein